MPIAPIPLPRAGGLSMPSVGIGTWRIGEGARPRADEVAALRHAHALGFRHFDTAEMYGDGRAEEVLGEAMRGLDRDGLFLVSKVYPWNAGAGDIRRSCEASLARLGTDRLDLYLLHWPGSIPFEETLDGMRALRDDGRIRAFGISNFDADDLAHLEEAGLADEIAVNQVMHNIPERGIEVDLLPMMKAAGIACVAYSPLEAAPLCRIPDMRDLAEEVGLTMPQFSLAWHVTRGVSVPIPKSGDPAHLDELRDAVDVTLPASVLERVDALAPPRQGALAIR